MSIKDFEALSDEERKIAIFEAEKISERQDADLKYEIFRIDGFYIEIRTCLSHAVKRMIKTNEFNKLPFGSTG
jgi:hypothetical protein